ncbi:nucleoside triphosphate pyrophosphohydrolase [Blastomonas sp.]|uniref:nucleoside triphosphate pyrophosphohydrolase n=1 Tax=Blastomonas sp. TaxID=1909299 RepID=UPI0026238B94|nr:nucleoside triphosphate pyrophosphohydrolase [Blastomonas sp.]MDM7957190.1 nucleoside triphosphate pyrophosphohydrolase [Blastomonas sp.]
MTSEHNPTDQSDTSPSAHAPSAPLDRLVAIMARLRDPENGCPWDVAQDFASIAPYTIEEAYEVADAIERNDMAALKDELGDLLLQVVFHSRMAEEAGHFSVGDVVESISDKMVRRHPHIFADQSVEQWDWEAIKAEERSDGGSTSAMDGVAVALPALMRAQKLQKRAARTGFDWPDVMGAVEKIGEEIEELLEAETGAERIDEAGDVLFAAVNMVRHMGVSAEDALRAANAKFERRFRAMETDAGDAFVGLSLTEKEELWQRAKQSTRPL